MPDMFASGLLRALPPQCRRRLISKCHNLALQAALRKQGGHEKGKADLCHCQALRLVGAAGGGKTGHSPPLFQDFP